MSSLKTMNFFLDIPNYSNCLKRDIPNNINAIPLILHALHEKKFENVFD